MILQSRICQESRRTCTTNQLAISSYRPETAEDPPDEGDEALQDGGNTTSGEKPNVPRIPTKYNLITVTVYDLHRREKLSKRHRYVSFLSLRKRFNRTYLNLYN